MISAAVAALMLAASPAQGGAHLRILSSSQAMDGLDPEQIARVQSILAGRAATLANTAIAAPAIDADLAWPLQPASGFAPFGYYGTGYFVDHDPRFPNLLQDYTCGERTYDLDSGYNH